MSLYDHHEKAGNEGDVVKHVALTAAVCLEASAQEGRFRYADLYAGHASHPLGPKGLEWPNGIGRIHEALRSGTSKLEAHAGEWYRRYLAPRPKLVHGTYPGSTVVAFDAAASVGTEASVSAWDTSPASFVSLWRHWGPEVVHHRAATLNEGQVKEAHFLFIDPPDKKGWASVRAAIETAKKREQGILVWLPLTIGRLKKGVGGQEDDASATYREEARKLGCWVVRVLWQKQRQGTGGCQLLFRLREDAVAAVRSASFAVAPLLASDALAGTQEIYTEYEPANGSS